MKNITLFLMLFVAGLLNAAAKEYTKTELDAIYSNAFGSGAKVNHVTVHDPSVVIGYEVSGKVTGEPTEGAKKIYCIFGSHMAWAKSYDLQNWTMFSNNINPNNLHTLFGSCESWAKKYEGNNYNMSGNMWAPDVIWNKKMGKWCMYMSVNADKWYSQIVLLTADNLLGTWTFVGPVVYSGFTSAAQAAETDYYKATGDEPGTFPARYNINRNGNHTYGMNAIDPCITYGEDGEMWMTYGSWFGGLYAIKIDESTGLRDYERKYDVVGGTAENAQEDPYQGIKVAGGNHKSGEASYIEKIGNYYYLFVTNGGLAAAGGYNMRVFRSTKVTGPFKDVMGHDARYLTSTNNTGAGDVNGSTGVRLMSYYKWDHQTLGYTAQGHNSCVVDTDGKIFLVYHTRFNDGTEGHQVRVHQMFETPVGITAAPFEYRGETLKAEGYAMSEVAGSYGVLSHGYGTDYAKLACVTEIEVNLNEDGTVSGARTGSWKVADGSNNIEITFGGEKFVGVLIEQNIEDTKVKTLCFTANGEKSNKCVWGYKKKAAGQTFDDEVVLAYNAKTPLSVLDSKVYKGTFINFNSTGYYGCQYKWTPADESLISPEGKVSNDIAADTKTTVNLEMTCGDCTYTMAKTVTISKSDATDGYAIDNSQLQSFYSTSAVFNNYPVTEGITAETGLSISFIINGYKSDWDAVMKSKDGNYVMYLSVLHYGSCNFYEGDKATIVSSDAKADGRQPHELFYTNKYKVTVSFNPDGTVQYYRDGKLMLTFVESQAPSAGSGYKPKDIVAKVIDYYRKGELTFVSTFTNVLVGTSVQYGKEKEDNGEEGGKEEGGKEEGGNGETTPESNAIGDISADDIVISQNNGKIVVAGAKAGSVVTVYSATGAVVYRGDKTVISVPTKGLVIVTVDGKKQKLLL